MSAMNPVCPTCGVRFYANDLLVKVLRAYPVSSSHPDVNVMALDMPTIRYAHQMCPPEKILEANRKVIDDELNRDENRITFRQENTSNLLDAFVSNEIRNSLDEVVAAKETYLRKILDSLELTIEEFNEQYYLEEQPIEMEVNKNYSTDNIFYRFATKITVKRRTDDN